MSALGDATTAALEYSARVALRGIADPCSIAAGAPVDIVDMGLVRDVSVEAAGIKVTLRFTSPFCSQAELICGAVQSRVALATGMQVEVDVDLDDDWEPGLMAPEARLRLRAIRPLGDAVRVAVPVVTRSR